MQLLVAAAIRITMGPPVFYRQCRPGLHARPFVVLKFRTMLDKEAPDGASRTREQRFTRTGRLIRRLSLDEIPQLLNVLKGEMSMVGPRPLLIEYLPGYTPEQLRRHEAKPGITGLAQVRGRQEIPWEERFRLDVWYVDHWSLRLDAKIILATVRALFEGQREVDASSPVYYLEPRSAAREER
jgi:sugar transferase EpsL